MRQSRIACVLLFAFLSVPVFGFAAAATPNQQSGAASNYPDKASGLKKFIQDALKAKKENDQQKLNAYLDSIVAPSPNAWFSEMFGQRLGPPMARAYTREIPAVGRILEKTLANASRDKMNEVVVRRFDYSCDIDGTETDYPVLAIRQKRQPLYVVRLTNGTYTLVVDFFAYIDGAFRFLPNLEVPRLATSYLPTGQVTPAGAGNADENEESVPASISSQAPPEYPFIEEMEGKQGVVQLYVLVGADGALKEDYVLSGACYFAQSAQKAVKKWTFSPAKDNGKPYESYTIVTLSFSWNRKSLLFP